MHDQCQRGASIRVLNRWKGHQSTSTREWLSLGDDITPSFFSFSEHKSRSGSSLPETVQPSLRRDDTQRIKSTSLSQWFTDRDVRGGVSEAPWCVYRSKVKLILQDATQILLRGFANLCLCSSLYIAHQIYREPTFLSFGILTLYCLFLGCLAFTLCLVLYQKL